MHTAGAIEAGRIVQLLAREVSCGTGAAKLFSGAGVAGGVTTIKGWKQFDCVAMLADGSRWMVGLCGFEPPSIEEVQRLFASRPAAFRRVV